MNRTTFDLIAVGGGTAGLVAAAGGAGLGARVALAERHRMGGECLWTGCVPSKALLAAGHQLKAEMIAQEPGKGTDVAATTKVEARVGMDGTLRRFGRAQALRGENPAVYDDRRKEYGHEGPYMPIILEACTEKQSAYEYQHGSVSYGAFTYALCESLNMGRAPEKKAPPLTFEMLINATKKRVKPVASGPQTPQLVCATVNRNRAVFR